MEPVPRDFGNKQRLYNTVMNENRRDREAGALGADLVGIILLDVELLRPEQPEDVVVRRWRESFRFSVPAARQPHVLSTADYESPVNGGLFTLAWPSRALATWPR